MDKVDFKELNAKVESGEWTLWRLGEPSKGVAVTYPNQGTLYVHYLRGVGLFDSLTPEDLQRVVHNVGLKAMVADVVKASRKILLSSVGFQTIMEDNGTWTMELSCG